MIEVYDIETLNGAFIYCSLPVLGSKYTVFVCSKTQNDLPKLLEHLDQKDLLQVGFNNIAFDAQVITFLLENRERFLYLRGDEIAAEIYDYAQHVIGLTNSGEFPPTPYWQLPIKQLDLFKINHFDNLARRTSLKALQIAMRLDNVMDMPFDHRVSLNEQQIRDAIVYCKNDVYSTREFYRRCNEAIQLRKDLEDEYKTSFLNLSDSSLGEKIFAILLCREMKIRPDELKQLRTFREYVEVGKIILPYIKFDLPQLTDLLEQYRNLIVVETKDSVSIKVNLNGLDVYYGAGGVHGCTTPGVYTSTDTHIIHDIDVTSFYPNLAIVNGYRPKHLGKSFTDIYRKVFEERQQIPKDNPLNKAYKLMLNSVYGKSNSKYSYLYDPAFTLKITVNGQLLITMLAEKLAPHVEILQINTDGITVKYPKEVTSTITSIMEWWQELTKLSLESTYYSQMVVENVNNYMAVDMKGKIKSKGRFSTSPEWHQDPSFLIVPRAVQKFFIEGVDPRVTITNGKDQFDFLGRVKFRGSDYGVVYENGEHNHTQKNVRYYVSKTGSPLMKHATITLKTGASEKRESVVAGGSNIKVMNKIEKGICILNDVDIEWYVDEAYKIISTVLPNVNKHGEQLVLC